MVLWMELAQKTRIIIITACVGILTQAGQSFAVVMHLHPSVMEEVLSETVATAFAPNSINIEDYSLEWSGAALSHVKFSLVPGSLQWVRVQDVLTIPRGRLEV